MSDSVKATPLYAGELRDRITVQQYKKAVSEDGYGQIDRTLDANWTDYCSRRAKVKTVGGQDVLNPDGSILVSTVMYEIRVRYDSLTKGIKPPMRILFGDKKLTIKSAIDPLDTKQQIVITAVAETS
jgi:SPP1 family predicted phage head-tail adaptor